jgi:riboflavin synthase
LFTGIIEEVGKLLAFRRGRQGASMVISAPKIGPSLRIGDSVSVNGVCLTATGPQGSAFSCDLSAETIRRSSFQHVREGTALNLERPLAVGGRLGGHIVLGHVDAVGRLAGSAPSGDGSVLEFGFPKEIARYLVHKGSVAVDGISLTVASLEGQSFKVAVIPYTYASTNLRYLRMGDAVNLEADVIGKYIERFFQLGGAEDRSSGSALKALWEEGS